MSQGVASVWVKFWACCLTRGLGFRVYKDPRFADMATERARERQREGQRDHISTRRSGSHTQLNPNL